MNRLPNQSQIQNILKYCNLDEGFEQIAPEFLKHSVNPVLCSHIQQLRYHRKEIEKLLEEEHDRLVYEDLYE